MPAKKPVSPRKPSRPAARPEKAEGLGAAAGRAGALALLAGARIVAARPVLFGSLALFSTLAGVVADNALNRQTGRHPHPMLMTRGAEPSRLASARLSSPAEAAPVPTARHAATPPVPSNDPRIVPFPMVHEAQQLLAQQGYYRAEIDGRAGQATDMAIRDFQAAKGLKVDGMATPLLLSQLRQAANPPPPLGDDPIARLASGGGVDPASTGGIASAGGSELVRQIQARLAEARVADLKPDGILGERTRAAIRTFQALESLDVTGEPSEEVLARLGDSGASAMR
ncbi:peptidoglycan-binding protein [Aureimonas sp. AU20]|uniref:peptidoglycan-binding domain-containing protein n=1 Tax=Aureimonas sp. AU20 TaxID=1349819 RepID=UPI00071FB949|nr:peptidoglycan-binding protein [Aureimonas sp. AU20]ALN73984.1 hypothetical protein M673_14750 [Aureimonas sp. AU20]